MIGIVCDFAIYSVTSVYKTPYYLHLSYLPPDFTWKFSDGEIDRRFIDRIELKRDITYTWSVEY